MTENEMYKLCLKIATKAHKGQTRWSGEPYIMHSKALAKQLEDDDLKCMAILHDVLEDTILTEEDLIEKGVKESIVARVILLSRFPETSYKDFILDIMVDRFATKVKIADLKHNLSDLKKGSLRDKYELALYILEESLEDLE